MDTNISKLQELENYASSLLAPPNIISDCERRLVEEKLIQFSKSDISFDECRFIIESSKSSFVCFHAYRLLKNKLIREWNVLSSDEIQLHFSYSLNFAFKKLPCFVMEECYQCLAMMCKKSIVEERFEMNLTDSILTYIEQIVTTNMNLDCLSILKALLVEFSNISNTNACLLHLDAHRISKSLFEQSFLKRIFYLMVNLLAGVSNANTTNVQNIKAILTTTHELLNWSFSKVRMSHNLSQSSFGIFKPPESWKDIIFDSGFVGFLFSIHQKIRLRSDIASLSLQCLCQLSTITGPILSSSSLKSIFLPNFLQAYLLLFSENIPLEYELTAISDIVKNLLNSDINAFFILPENLLVQFLNFVTTFTCNILIEMSRTEKELSLTYSTALEIAVDCWVLLANHHEELNKIYDGRLKTIFYSTLSQLLIAYVQINLIQQDSLSHNNLINWEEEDVDVDDESEDANESQSNSIMLSMATLARIISNCFIPWLQKLLSEKISSLCKALNDMKCDSNNVSFQSNLHFINSDLNWMILFIGEVLTNDNSVDIVNIPKEIMLFSISNDDKGISCSLKDVIFTGQTDNIDHVILIIASVLSLADRTQNAVVKDKLFDHLSPQLQSTILIFLSRIVSWVCLDEDEYSQISLNILMNFGEDSPIAHWLIHKLFENVEFSLSYWNSDINLILKAIHLLFLIVNNKKRCNILLQNDRILIMINNFCSNNHPHNNLAPLAKNKLCRCFIMAMQNHPDHLQLILNSLHCQLKSVSQQSSNSQHVLLAVLDSLSGVPAAIRQQSASIIFSYFNALLPDAIAIMNIFHNYEEIVRAILTLFEEVSKHLPLYLGTNETFEIQKLTINMMQVYQKHNKGRLSFSTEVVEENCSDILIITTIISNLLLGDYLNFSSEANISSSLNPQLVIIALDILVPLFSLELLRFPTLCNKYISLLSYLGEMHIDQLCQLPENLYKSLMSSVQFALEQHACEVGRACLELISHVALHILHASQTAQHVLAISQHFLTIIFKQVFNDFIEESLWSLYCSTLLALMTIHQTLFYELVSSLINITPNKYAIKMTNIFNQLINDPYFNLLSSSNNNAKNARLKYLETFESSIFEIHSYTKIH